MDDKSDVIHSMQQELEDLRADVRKLQGREINYAATFLAYIAVGLMLIGGACLSVLLVRLGIYLCDNVVDLMRIIHSSAVSKILIAFGDTIVLGMALLARLVVYLCDNIVDILRILPNSAISDILIAFGIISLGMAFIALTVIVSMPLG